MSLPAILLYIIGLLCVLYGTMVFLIRSGTMFFAVWIAMGAGFILLGALTQISFWGRLSQTARALLLAAAIAAFLLIAVCEGFVLSGFGRRAPEGLDYLIVLGAQVREDGPSAVLRYRLDEAAAYMRENRDTVCIVTGGQGATEPVAEGISMRDYLVGLGIDASRILVEDKARNTIQNILFSMPLMSSPDASCGIVTNNFHVARALALARKQGLTDIYAIAAPSDPLFLPNNMFWELFGFTKDFLAGNL